ncbi:contact-dependent growth inhibition system immunity protein [Micromonospora sp. NPDC005979]|uniref:contact-dependent growth inhibition system immunity protein n=1 Tax=Micromonospora sp. NPDC005979 TaxID=3156726 RepID=UPI0033BA8213
MTTIEELERDVWPDPSPDDAFLITRCTELRRKPLAEFTVEDLRIMLGQEIGVSALLPRAVNVLLRDPLVCGLGEREEVAAWTASRAAAGWTGGPTAR